MDVEAGLVGPLREDATVDLGITLSPNRSRLESTTSRRVGLREKGPLLPTSIGSASAGRYIIGGRTGLRYTVAFCGSYFQDG